MFLVVPVTLLGMTKRSLKEVADAVNHRRRELELTELRLRTMTGLDRKTLQALLEGTRWAQEETRIKVEAALQWSAGSIQDIRDGKYPTPLEATDEPPLLQTIPDEELLAEIRRRMRGDRHVMDDPTESGASRQAQQAQEDGLSDHPETGATRLSRHDPREGLGVKKADDSDEERR